MYESHEKMLAAQRATNKKRRSWVAILANPSNPMGCHGDIVLSEWCADEWRVRFTQRRINELLAQNPNMYPATAVNQAHAEWTDATKQHCSFREFGELAL